MVSSKLQFESLEGRRLLAVDQLLISEFMASNDESLRDGFGRSSDWVEVFNAGDSPMDLTGFHLTDDSTDLEKWTFAPATVLQAGDFLLVFASGLNSADPLGYQHTNFELSASGEYLALVSPQGQVVHDFGDVFPAQATDVSYGLGMSSTSGPATTVLDAGASGALHIPVDDSLGFDWIEPDFDDSTWNRGLGGFGYEGTPDDYADLIQTTVPPGTTTFFSRFEFHVDANHFDQLTLRVQYDDGFSAFLNGQPVAESNASTFPAWNDVASSSHLDQQAIQFTDFDITNAIPLLRTEPRQNVLAIQSLNVRSQSSDMLIRAEIVSRTRDETMVNEPLATGFFQAPTPLQANRLSFSGFVEDTSFSVDRGFFDKPTDVLISTPTTGATISYTTDGSLPSPTHGTLVNAADAQIAPSATVLISKTTTLRAMAFKEDHQPTNVDTQTYIYLEDVLSQDPLSDPLAPDYPTVWQANAAADFEMDPAVVSRWDDFNSQRNDFGIREALASLPTMSLVMDHDDLWNASTGIYPNATNRGDSWRRPASVEYFDPATGAQFQYNVGVQMHGNASRDNVRLKKHSFRLIFNNEFGGPGRLRYPLFDGSDFDDINTVVLRASFTDSFATRTATGRYSPLDSQYTRDVWMRDSQLAMGNLSADSTFVHLYINGLYWGLYSPAERPDDAFMAAHVGGESADWDIIKDFNELFKGNRTAWDAMFGLARQLPSGGDTIYHRLQGNNPDGSRNEALPVLLDTDNLIDFMLLHLQAGPEDWPHHNWYAARNRVDPGQGFQFFVWDQEIVLDGRYRDRTNVSNDFTPAELYDLLRRHSPEFRQRFADRVQHHMFNDGALTVAANQARWMARADQIEAAIIAESARWGDAREGEVVAVDGGQPAVTIPTITVTQWRAERDNVHDNYFPESHALAIQRFIADDLFSNVNAPTLSQNGGLILAGFELSMQSNAEFIYYTLDGSDPRMSGGGVSPNAELYNGSVPIVETVTINARSAIGEQWSPLSSANFIVGQAANASNLAITELHYHPADPRIDELSVDSTLDQNDFEFVEIRNVGPLPVALSGVRFTDGIDFSFDDSQRVTIDSGQFAVIVSDLQAFRLRYGDELDGIIAGQYSGQLSNGGERIVLTAADNSVIQAFTYDDENGWPQQADGMGPSLVAIDVTADYDDANNWQSSNTTHGSPGQMPLLRGDFNGDQHVDAIDIDLLFAALRQPNYDSRFDLDGDSLLSRADVDELVRNVLETDYGDVDLDGDIDTADLTIMVTQFSGAGATTDRTWATGDTDGDGDVDTADRTAATINFTGAALANPLDARDRVIAANMVSEHKHRAARGLPTGFWLG